MDLLRLGIAALAASSAGALALVGVAHLAIAVEAWAARPRTKDERPWVERVEPYLAAVPVPGFAARWWGRADTALKLQHAGIPWRPQAYVGLCWAWLWLSLVMAILALTTQGSSLVSSFLAGLILLGGLLAPPAWLGLNIDRRRTSIDLALPDFLDRLTLGLEAGLGFEVALRRTAANFRQLLGEELRRVVRQLDRGHSKSAALEELIERTPSQDLRAFVASVKQSERLGTSLSKTLRVQSALLRARRRRRAQEASRRLPVLIVFPLVFFFLPALLIIYLAPPLLHLFLGR